MASDCAFPSPMARNSNGNRNSIPGSSGSSHQMQDQFSPFYIHPDESSTVVTVTPLLTGENYHTWSRMMRRELVAWNKYGFVDGSIPVPTPEDLYYEAWKRCNNLVLSWIMNSVSGSMARSIGYADNAVDVWNDLKERFSEGDLIRVYRLQQELCALKQGNASVTEFCTRLKILWGELEHIRPFPQCTCAVPCTCLSIRNAQLYREQDCIIRFLSGLNDQFGGVRFQILLMDPLPPLNRVFSMILQQERLLRGPTVRSK